MRPFRFGILTGAESPAELVTVSREAEERGYSTLAFTDHLDLSGDHVAQLSWLPAVGFAAAATTTLRFTTMVANQDLRHPAVLAREIATLDVLSGGRFELGIGAGWNPTEYLWAGLSLDAPRDRIRRLAEYADVIRGLVDGTDPAPFDFFGEYFTITGMPRVPASPQHPMPIMLGGAQKSILSLAARTADIVNILTLRDIGTADEVLAPKLQHIRAAASEAGRDPELSMSIVLVATEADDPVDAVTAALPRSPFAQHVAESQSIEAVSRAPHVLAGHADRIGAELVRRRERWGISYYIIPSESMSDFQPVVDRLAGA